MCVREGGGGGGGREISSGRVYVHVVKFMGGGGGLCPCCKIHGGDYVHVYKFTELQDLPYETKNKTTVFKNPLLFYLLSSYSAIHPRGHFRQLYTVEQC